MTCTERFAELVEHSRAGESPSAALRAHLGACKSCAVKWESELALTAHLRAMRIPAAQPRPLREAGRQELLRRFDAQNRSAEQPRWRWTLSAAAAMFLAIGVGAALGHHARREPLKQAPPAAVPARGIGRDQTLIYEVSSDAEALSNDNFIAVPYAPPLATGEIVRVVHTDMYPEALAGMGIDVSPEWSGNLDADVVVGQDGFPRAVRIATGTQF